MRVLTDMEVMKQGDDKMACGTTSLAMVVNFLTKKNITYKYIDKDIRRDPWISTSPPDLVEYAKKMGLQAQEYNHGTIDDIKYFTGMGIPMIAYYDPSPEKRLDIGWHWVVIVGVEETEGKVGIILNNPSPGRETQEWDRFSKKWANMKALGLKWGYNNYFVGIGTKEDTLPIKRTKDLFASNITEKGLMDLLNGFAYVRRFKCSGLGQLLYGLIWLIFGFICLILSNIYWGFRGFINWLKSLFRK